MASDFTLIDRYLLEEGRIQITGVQALVRVLLDQARLGRQSGLELSGFVSGYEGSPLAGFDMELDRRKKLLSEHDLVHRPGLNEELATTSVFGTQLAAGLGTLRGDGVFGAWYGKSPGLDRASDAFRHANMAGTHPLGGAVAFVGDDPNAKSSSVPSASENALADLSIPVFYPADPQDVLELGRHAFELSRASGLWTSLKMVANVADASGTATVTSSWTAPRVEGGYTHQPNGRMLGRELAALERSLYEIRLPLVLEYLRASDVNKLMSRADDRIGIVSAGKSFLDVQQALHAIGVDNPHSHGVRQLKLGAIYPLDPSVIREFADGLTEIVVVEEKKGIIELALKEILYGLTDAPRIHGKSVFTAVGELDADRIAGVLVTKIPGAVRPRLSQRTRINLPMATRTPYFCSGCPHNSSIRVPEGSVVGGGIGCHTMALFLPPEQVGDVTGITQMGGEGAQWIGMAPFVKTAHWIQNIGDGTFIHSGSLAIRAAIAAGVNVTYKLLYNSAVAMTGGQVATGNMSIDRVAALLDIEGVSKIVVTSDEPRRLRRKDFPAGTEIRDRSELLQVQEELAKLPGVTVLIHDQECATEVRRKRRRGERAQPTRRVMINELVCEGCGDCGEKSNCLSVRPVDTEFGRKTQIHQGSCNFDESCLQGNCPSFLTVRPSNAPRRREPDLGAADLPAPRQQTTGDCAVRIAGIGGTGVVTLAQILAVAAFLDGKYVRTLDQTGLAQKGGAVISDVRITAQPLSRASRLAAGECDLYLVADMLVASESQNLRAANTDRTVAVVSTEQVPTGEMIVGRVPLSDPEGLSATLQDATSDAYFIDAHGIAVTHCGSDQYANIVLLGVAFQLGRIPITADLIEKAIDLNGSDVQTNLQAFRRGRQAVAAADQRRDGKPALELAMPSDTGPDARLREVVAKRVTELTAYQDQKYASSYSRFVTSVAETPGVRGDVAEAVAHQLYRLMAYKDEYEVARLSLDQRLKAAVDEEFGEGARYQYLLKPPIFTRFGLQKKVALGEWFSVVFRLLYALRGLRGTFLDPFGHDEIRRRERGLIAEYRQLVMQALAIAPGEPVTSEIASLPETIRGFDEVKLRSLVTYDQRRSELLESLRSREKASN